MEAYAVSHRMWMAAEERKAMVLREKFSELRKMLERVDHVAHVRPKVALVSFKEGYLNWRHESVKRVASLKQLTEGYLQERKVVTRVALKKILSLRRGMFTRNKNKPNFLKQETISEQVQNGAWDELQPSYFPAEYKNDFRLFRRSEDINGFPVTKCEAFFPQTELEKIERLMCDTSTRLAWDRNLSHFSEVGESGKPEEGTFYHIIESSVVKRFGFKGRDFLYKRVKSPCGERCKDITFASIEGDSPIAGTNAVRGFIHYQNYRIEEAPEGGTKLTITALVDRRHPSLLDCQHDM
eukprot:TRINITY_DN1518_c0_g1_i2.p1 TRINITY_DN1518_c0_g1~~TRINITY_DN1518_c0_g1_i2.p1  ORF type:complete len:296 (+),score=53.85 TRINITY_DN1518_c0_g1_i2:68-955(+)